MSRAICRSPARRSMWRSTATAPQTFGVTPDQIQNALFTAYGTRQVSTIYTSVERIPGDSRSRAAVSAQPGSALEALRSILEGRAGAARFGGEAGALGRPAQRKSLRPVARRDDFVQPRPGLRPGRCRARIDEVIRDLRMPPTLAPQFQGTVQEFQQSFKGLSILLIVADPRDLHRAGNAVRELHSPHHDSLRPALGRLRRAADAEDLPQGARSLRVRRSHHAVRRGEEERDHDDRFRHRSAARGRQERRSTPFIPDASCASGPS